MERMKHEVQGSTDKEGDQPVSALGRGVREWVSGDMNRLVSEVWLDRKKSLPLPPIHVSHGIATKESKIIAN